jgi:ubiquinone/menaquinone biosynthesis C-methylase UbiE
VGSRPDHLTGVELLADRVAEARRLCPTAVTIRCESATELGFPDAAFDLVLQSTVFTSVLDRRVKERIAFEMLRVLKKEGLILWYDFHVSNPRNPDVQGLKKRET